MLRHTIYKWNKVYSSNIGRENQLSICKLNWGLESLIRDKPVLMGCHMRCGPSVCIPEGVRAVQGGRGAGTCSISTSSRLSRGKRRGREQRRGTSSISRVLLESLFELLNALFVTVANFVSCALAVVAFLLLSR